MVHHIIKLSLHHQILKFKWNKPYLSAKKRDACMHVYDREAETNWKNIPFIFNETTAKEIPDYKPCDSA